MKVFAAHNPDADIRRQSSAGGIFSLLAHQTLKDGGVVYGVGFDSQWHIAHQRVTTPDGLKRLRGSKYAYSIIGTAISDAAADLAAGRKVLFSGTPCQIAAMRKRVGADTPNLLLVEVVCHGAPEQKYWNQYLDELCVKLKHRRCDIASISFRDKRTGWKNYSFTIIFKDGKEFSQPHDDNLYMRAFLKDLTLREACFNCPFKYPNGSRADITLGDFWGISQLVPEIDNDKGTTLIIARTHRGWLALNPLISPLADLDYNNVILHNPAIVSSPQQPMLRKKFATALDSHNVFSSIAKHYTKPTLRHYLIKSVRKLTTAIST